MKKIIFIFIFIILLNGVTLASIVNLSANEVDTKGDYLTFSGDVEITNNDTILNSNTGEYWKDESRLKLSEDVAVSSTEFRITSNDMEGFLKDDTYNFEGNVVMMNINEDKEGFTLKSNTLNLFSDTNNFTAEDSIYIEYNDKIITADRAEYINEGEQLTLLSNVIVDNGNSDQIKSDKLIIMLNDEIENFEARGRVNIIFEVEE